MAVYFDSTADIIGATSGGAVAGNVESRTICGLARIETNSSSATQLICGFSNSQSYFSVRLDWRRSSSDSMYLYCQNGSGGTSPVTFASRPAVGELFFWYVKCSGTGSNAVEAGWGYLDGSAMVTATNTLVSGSSGSCQLMTVGGELSSYVRGQIAGVRQWTTALSAAELENERYQISANRRADLIGEYPFWDVATSLTDFSGNGATLSNVSGFGGTAPSDTAVSFPVRITARRAGRAVVVSAAAGGGATALSGQSVTASAGTLSPSVAYTAALTGSAVTASAGTLTPSVAVSVGLTGSQTTTAAGALAPSLSVALAGAAATVSAGTVDPSQATTAALTGSAATAAAGTLSPAIAKTLSGQSVAASAGTVAPSVAISVALTGASVTASAGTLTPTQDTVADLAGSAVTTAAGTLGVTHSVALSGATVTAAAGTVAAQASYTASLSGAAVTATAGTLSPATSVALAGEAVAVSAGDVAASVVGDVTIALSGAAVSVLAGTITPQGATVGLHGRPLKRKRLTRKRLPDDYGEPQVAPAAIEPAQAVQSAPPRAQPTSADYAAAAAAIGATRAEIRALRQRSPIDAEIAELMAARLREEAAAEFARLREQQEIDSAALALILAIAV